MDAMADVLRAASEAAVGEEEAGVLLDDPERFESAVPVRVEDAEDSIFVARRHARSHSMLSAIAALVCEASSGKTQGVNCPQCGYKNKPEADACNLCGTVLRRKAKKVANTVEMRVGV